MKVYYCIDRMTGMRKKRAISIVFENSETMPHRYFITMKKAWEIFHEREQTNLEEEDAIHATRVFTYYTFFLDDKKFKGDIDKLLQYIVEDDDYMKNNKMAHSEFIKAFNKVKHKL